jgi:hypothetical protein
MCDVDRCYGVRDGKVLYADGDHLTIYGALALTNALKSSLPEEFLACGSVRRSLSASAPSQSISP